MGGGHMTRRDAERVRDETSGIGLGPSGCRDGVGTGVERVITVSGCDRGYGQWLQLVRCASLLSWSRYFEDR